MAIFGLIHSTVKPCKFTKQLLNDNISVERQYRTAWGFQYESNTALNHSVYFFIINDLFAEDTEANEISGESAEHDSRSLEDLGNALSQGCFFFLLLICGKSI